MKSIKWLALLLLLGNEVISFIVLTVLVGALIAWIIKEAPA